MSDGYYISKKTDDICDDVCGQGSKAAATISRLKCVLRGFDIRTLLCLFILIPFAILAIYLHGQKLTYFFRPLWESPPQPFRTLPHYHTENATMASLCSLHGWGVRDSPRRVYDAVLFSNEKDLLTVRWKELYPYVTQFVLLESNSTFTGLPKPFVFKTNKDQFSFVEPRLTYGNIGGRFIKGENPFVEEAYQRVALDKLLRIAGIEEDDLLIMSDVDEIPSAHTINLLRWCDDILRSSTSSLRTTCTLSSTTSTARAGERLCTVTVRKTRYAHFRQSDVLLSDSGWHCSFCFRYISDFVFKMKAYSHSDRVRFSHYLNPNRIQDVICKGTDLFDMLPEEYTFKEMIGKMGPVPRSYSAVHLPSYLLDNAEKYKYLLPGNCIRERQTG
ncbi:hypothetical protein Bca52824_068448 [Brassica carinata]|uniref:Uncharacterized protein n=1 Tax=Brassica carinata TaxID=52824 RepID=A0A8X7Q5B3_BRACI|nr:hypothetical protein Bca52824_068448 [Brassica carinata]